MPSKCSSTQKQGENGEDHAAEDDWGTNDVDDRPNKPLLKSSAADLFVDDDLGARADPIIEVVIRVSTFVFVVLILDLDLDFDLVVGGVC